MSKLEKNHLDLELDEATETGTDAMSADPIEPAGGKNKKRLADKGEGSAEKAGDVEDNVKTPQGSNSAGIKEAFAGLLDGHGLSEEFMTKTVAVFEAAVNERVLSERKELEEQFEEQLSEQIEATIEDLVEKVDSYLNYVTETWMTENKVEIESNIKVEVAESLLNGIKGLVVEHNIDIDEQELDVITDLENDLAESKARYNELVQEVIDLKEEKTQLELKSAFQSVTEELTDTQIEKLAVLSEGISYEDIEDYTMKLEAIRDNYFTESYVSQEDEIEFLEEEVDEKAKPVIDPNVARYVDSIGRLTK